MGHEFSFCKACETPLDCDFCDKLEALIEPGRMTLQELKADEEVFSRIDRHWKEAQP